MTAPTIHYPTDDGLIETFHEYLCKTSVSQEEFENICDFLIETDFYGAPASTRYHLCCPHGLITHTLNVASAIENLIAEKELKKSGILTALLHDFCKADFYKEYYTNFKYYNSDASNPRDLKEDAAGTFVWRQKRSYTVAESFLYGHGEKSVYIAQQHLSVSLTDREAQAIRYHMGDFFHNPETSQVYAKNKLALYLHMADLYAASWMDLSAEECEKYNTL